jgi:hypothetical protein
MVSINSSNIDGIKTILIFIILVLSEDVLKSSAYLLVKILPCFFYHAIVI